jgi:hypothetical protein
MTTNRLDFWLAAGALLSLLILSGCSDSAPSSQLVDDSQLNLTDTYGGYTAAGEPPGFGDEEILTADNSQPAEDAMANSAVVDSLKRLADRDVYSLELLWGNLEFDSSATEITDWSGSLSVERGAIVAVRLIAFERGDRLIRPRRVCSHLEWVSYTLPHFDGMLVFIYDPQPDSFATENQVTFSTTPYSRTFTMSELASLDTVIDVGENQLSISSFKTEPLACQNGFFQGRWHRQGKGDSGKFHGRWLSADGYLLGHVKGHFGIRDDGEQVLFGKWIGLGGSCRGLLRGEWGFDPQNNDRSAALGWFAGEWDNAAGTRTGDFEGNWIAAPPRTIANEFGNDRGGRGHGHGLWRGQWAEICE